MKKDIGKRSYVEMYLITKEDKNLFDKCVLHLNKKTDEKLPSDIIQLLSCQLAIVSSVSLLACKFVSL